MPQTHGKWAKPFNRGQTWKWQKLSLVQVQVWQKRATACILLLSDVSSETAYPQTPPS